jgi:hypothetical protein
MMTHLLADDLVKLGWTLDVARAAEDALVELARQGAEREQDAETISASREYCLGGDENETSTTPRFVEAHGTGAIFFRR